MEVYSSLYIVLPFYQTLQSQDIHPWKKNSGSMDHSLGDDLFQPYKKYIAELLQSQHNDQMISTGLD